MTSTTDHDERRYGHHDLVCGLAREFRDERAETHLTLRSTCTFRCHRNSEVCVGAETRSGPTPLVLHSMQGSRPVDGRFLPVPRRPYPATCVR